MTARNIPQHQLPSEDEHLERDVVEAAKRLGWIVPQTEDEVRQAEADLAEHPVSLPKRLEDPAVVWERTAPELAARAKVIRLPLHLDISRNLARAAREGGRVPEDVDQRMRKDREAAEGEKDRGQESLETEEKA